MKSSRWLWLAVVSVASACNLYNEVLLRGGQSDVGTGGSNASGGVESSGGGTLGDGGMGGQVVTGGAPGAGGEGFGGEGTGGVETGGSGGVSSGGSDSGGGGGSGGGSGGAPPLLPIGLIDAFESVGTLSYDNPPFHGDWERYIQPGGTWATTLTSAMVQARPDDTQDFAIHVVASTLNSWGAGVLVTVNDGNPMDWTEVDGITFDVATMNDELGLRVGIADINSHLPVCNQQNGGADCDKHMRAAQVFTIDDTFTTVDIPLAAFTDMWVEGRVSALDLTAVCALHFQLDPEGTAVDYYIDNVETY